MQKPTAIYILLFSSLPSFSLYKFILCLHLFGSFAKKNGADRSGKRELHQHQRIHHNLQVVRFHDFPFRRRFFFTRIFYLAHIFEFGSCGRSCGWRFFFSFHADIRFEYVFVAFAFGRRMCLYVCRALWERQKLRKRNKALNYRK